MRQDPVQEEVRAAEREIDLAYLSNPLAQMTFGEAAWYFLACCEDQLIAPIVRDANGVQTLDAHEFAALADHVVNHAKWPLRWFRKSCRCGTIVPYAYKGDAYQAAQDLSKLASNYMDIESAFTYASMKVGNLHLKENKIIASGPFRDDTRYEAYDRLIDLQEHNDELDFEGIADLLGDSVRVNGDKFSYQLNPKIVRDAMIMNEEKLAARFCMPFDWSLSQYSLGEFATMAKCLWTLSAIHYVARLSAASRGCLALGYSRALIVMGRDELCRRLVQYTKLCGSSVRAIAADMTFGSGNIVSPDPALQPLVPLTKTQIGWAPALLLTNSFERNLLVLLNRNPETREAYLRLSTQKEDLLRSRIIRDLDGLGFRFWHGEVPGWKNSLDLDLAIISDTDRCCLLLELKSFLAPADPREIQERSEDISRGIAQIKRRRLLAADQSTKVFSALNIAPDYDLSWGVASETSIGPGWVQDESVPVIRASHLVKRIIELGSLKEASVWLTDRQYLPVEGRDYRTVPVTSRIGNWSLDWYGIQRLADPVAPRPALKTRSALAQ